MHVKKKIQIFYFLQVFLYGRKIINVVVEKTYDTSK